MTKEERLPYLLRTLIIATGGLSALLGIVVLAGWYTHTIILIQVLPTFVPMQYNTALGFLLSGLGVLALVYKLPRLVVVSGGLVATVGILTLIEYIFGVDLGIDQLMMEHYVGVKTSHLGRMAPNTALCFMLTGTTILISYLFARYKWCTLTIGTLGSVVLGLGIIAFSGYMTGLESAYGWGNLTRMAVHTAFGFMVLGIGLFMFAWIKERGQEPTLPYWFPVPIAIVVLTFSVSLWQALHHVPAGDAATNLAPFFMLVFGIVLAFALAMTVNRAQKALSQAASIEKARIMLEARNREIEDLNVTLEKRVKEELATSREKDYMLIQQSRLAAMGEMIGHIAHQWRQPLNLLGLLLVNIKDDFEYDELDKANLDAYTSKAEKLIDKMSATIDDFRNFFHPNKEKEEFSPAKAIEETFKLIEDSFKYENINVTIEEETDVTVSGYPNEYSQVVLNLVNNARDAIKEKGGKDGSIMVNIGRDKGNCVVTITDDGGGIPEEIIEKIFDPYFSSKKEGGGTGLGLYMSKMIIEDNMDGRIEVRNVKGGARFRVLLPVASESNPS